MIEAKVSKNEIQLQCGGRLVNVCAETGLILRGIYQNLQKTAPDAAKEFRKMLTLMVTAPNSPLWAERLPGDPGGCMICKVDEDPVTVDMLRGMINAGASAEMVAEFLRDD